MSADRLTLDEARTQIEAIMDRIPASELPRISKVEPPREDLGPCVWFNRHSHGFLIGSGTVNGEPHPVDWHRREGITDLFDREAAQRYEAMWWRKVEKAVAAGLGASS